MEPCLQPPPNLSIFDHQVPHNGYLYSFSNWSLDFQAFHGTHYASFCLSPSQGCLDGDPRQPYIISLKLLVHISSTGSLALVTHHWWEFSDFTNYSTLSSCPYFIFILIESDSSSQQPPDFRRHISSSLRSLTELPLCTLRLRKALVTLYLGVCVGGNVNYIQSMVPYLSDP